MGQLGQLRITASLRSKWSLETVLCGGTEGGAVAVPRRCRGGALVPTAGARGAAGYWEGAALFTLAR